MSLPTHFNTPGEYFEQSTKFFKQYQFLFNFANTDLLINNVLDKIDVVVDKLDVFNENFDIRAVESDFLRIFFEKLLKLQVSYDFEEEDGLECFDVALSPKKKHEIVYLTKEIKKQFGNKCDLMVDFGSGLGYLDQHFFEKTNCNVLGLECSESHYVGAKKRQRKYYANSLQQVKYIKHTIGPESHRNINDFLMDKFPDKLHFGITGLHACADLTIDAINIFLNIEAAKHLIIMPCCYHKLAQNKDGFKNFPISNSLKRAYEEFKGFEYLKVPFLRLGAQPPEVNTKLENSVFNLLARAVLQYYANKHNCKIKRNKRKAVKTKALDNNFENYIQDAIKGFNLSQNEAYSDDHKVPFDLDELRKLWSDIDRLTLKKAGIFILLQNYLQPIIENYILFDRTVYLRENGVKGYFKKILNEKLSPRCLVLIGNK